MCRFLPKKWSSYSETAKKNTIQLQRAGRSTCLGEDFEAKGQTGQLQSWIEEKAKATAKKACAVETRRLQKSKERFGNATFLIATNKVDHAATLNTINLTI